MRLSIRWLVAPVMILLLSGCASVPPSVPSDYKVQKGSKNGIVFFTTSLTGSAVETIPNLSLRGLTVTYSRSFPMWDGRFLESGKPAFSATDKTYTLPTSQPMGILYAVELPEGTYEFYDLGGKSTSGYIKSMNRFSQQFVVRAGTVLYVGNYNIDYHPYDAMQRSMFTIRNQQERDIPLLKNQYRNLAPETIQIGIAKEAPDVASKP
jgi:uncharacterized protein YceK